MKMKELKGGCEQISALVFGPGLEEGQDRRGLSRAPLSTHRRFPQARAQGCCRRMLRRAEAQGQSAEAMMHLDEHVVEAAKVVAGSRPDVIAWICTAGSFMKGQRPR